MNYRVGPGEKEALFRNAVSSLFAVLKTLRGAAERSLQKTPGVGGSFRPLLEEQVYAAALESRVVRVVPQCLLVDKMYLLAVPESIHRLIEKPGIGPPGFVVARSQAQVLLECLGGFRTLALLFILKHDRAGRTYCADLSVTDEMGRTAHHEQYHDDARQENQIELSPELPRS